MAHTLNEAAAWMDGTVVGDGNTVWNRAMSLLDAESGDLVLIDGAKKFDSWANSPAIAAVVPRDFPAGSRPVIRVSEPLKAYLQLIQKLRGDRSRPREIHPTAIIDPSAVIGANASIGPYVVIGEGTILGDDCTLHSGVVIGANCRIGRANTLYPGVVLYDDSILGQRVAIHANSVVGADGYGYRTVAGKHVKVPQFGYVEIGDDVEIGANSCVDRGALDDTLIDDGVKLDNLVQVGHNVHIGAQSAMAGCVGIAGSARIGRHCTAGGGAIILGHLQLVDHVHITAATVVTRSILKPGQYSGAFPFDDNAAWEKNAATLRQLYSLRERIRALEKRQ